ncbi:hypothetical protein E4U12_007983 [Claviceps purpurea]|nr:hypothetical protein E4U12_007983 [Claviceps purpurea]KAG6288230.1 hypothetical protein E4U45_007892 [Claviceps purpurea]
MSNKRTDISSCRELIQDLIRDGYRQEDILSRVNTQVVAQDQRAISLRTLQLFIKENLSLDKPDLDGVRELVQTLIHEGIRQSDILGSVNEQLSANNQRTISLSTLKRNIRDWGFNQNTNRTDTNSLRELVQTGLADGDTTRQILEHVNTQRIARNEFTITMRTLQRRLKDWGLDRKSQHARILQESNEDISELLAQEVPVATIRRSMNEAIEEQGLPPISEPMRQSAVYSLCTSENPLPEWDEA